MSDSKDYSKLTLEELLIEEKKLKKNKILSALGTGFLIGLMVYGYVKNGFGVLYTVIPLFLIFANHRISQNNNHNLYKIRTEINTKNKN